MDVRTSTPRIASCIAALLLFAWPAGARAADPLKPLKAGTPPVIDGDLGDPVWRDAPTVTGFKSWLPDYGTDMPDQTVVSYAYDAENLYFAFRAYDRQPARIKASVTARDGISADDWVCINLDSFGDRQSLYAFYVNPLGIQGDSRSAAGQEDFGFDAVWYSAGRIDDQGFTIEVRIPFKSLRYGRADPVRMALIFERRVTRTSEQGTYPPLDPAAGPNFLTQNVPIEFAGIAHYRLLEVLPDAVYSHRMERQAGPLQETASAPEVGVSVKYGVTARLVFDGALNPDFSQVEADAGQIDVNRRYALFFAEKRPFFLEGRDSFNFPGADYGTLQSVVHTRTIVNPVAGAKLTGKLGAAGTVAAVYAVDERPDEAVAAGGPDHAQVAILRYKRSLPGDSYVGGFYTGREEGGAFNRVFGADGSLRVTKAGTLGFYAFGSSTRPRGEAERGGHAVLANYAHDDRNLSLYAQAFDVSGTFDTWSGYLTRAGVFQGSLLVVPRLYPKSTLVRRVEPMVIADFVRDAESGIWEKWYQGGVSVALPRSARLSAQYHVSNEVYARQSFDTSGLQATATGQLRNEIRLQGSFSNQRAIYYSAVPFGGTSTSATLAAFYEPSEQWMLELRGTYSGFSRQSDGRRLFDYGIYRARTTYQVNRYLFFRGIAEYNSYRRQLVTDVLASFTYIPGTVFHVGYGSLYEEAAERGEAFAAGRGLIETRRGFFVKASYLWRR